MMNYERLKNYHFHSSDNSILQRLFLSRYLNYCFTFIPNNIAPNLITLIGFISCLCSFIFLNIIKYFPKWKNYGFLFCSISIFFYWTCDGIDGKQARKTNSSSVLGQCFDHTVDSLTMPMIVLIFLDALTIESNKIINLIILISCYNFIFYSLKEKYTGLFQLDFINPPNEGIMFCCLLLFFKGIKSQKLEIFINIFNRLLFNTFILQYSLFQIIYILIVLQHLFNLMRLFFAIKVSKYSNLIYEIMICFYAILFCMNITNMDNKYNIIITSLIFSTINLEIIISNLNDTGIAFPFIKDLEYLLCLNKFKYIHVFSACIIFIRYFSHAIRRIKEFEKCLGIKWNVLSKEINK